MDKTEIIKSAKARFDKELHSEEYRKIHSDDVQLGQLLDLFDYKSEKNYLDIGTGNGYVAFALADQSPEIKVTGLDIAEKSIQKNNQIVQKQGRENLSFTEYDGTLLPFFDESFYGAVSRYAFHHFPDPMLSIAEIHRTLQQGGFFVYSDPETYPEDTDNFVDEFQRQIKDGHVHFYREKEITDLFQKNNFTKEKLFRTTITYPRILSDSYLKLFDQTSTSLKEKYKLKMEGGEVFITVSVLNILFRKNK